MQLSFMEQKTGYRSSEYDDSSKPPKTDTQIFVRYFMENVYKLRGVDYYIPKTRYPKYSKRAKDIIAELGSVEEALRFIDWFIGMDRFGNMGYSLDLMVSSPLINQYRAANPRGTGKGLTEGFVKDRKVDVSGGEIV